MFSKSSSQVELADEQVYGHTCRCTSVGQCVQPSFVLSLVYYLCVVVVIIVVVVRSVKADENNNK